MKYTLENIGKLKFKPILQFIEEYNLTYTEEAIGYHMKSDYIDWMQPSRDRFVVLSEKTLNFYKKRKNEA